MIAPPVIVLTMPPDTAAFLVAALRTYADSHREGGVPSFVTAAEALVDKLNAAIWEAAQISKDVSR